MSDGCAASCRQRLPLSGMHGTLSSVIANDF
jgi:hypothetical protein